MKGLLESYYRWEAEEIIKEFEGEEMTDFRRPVPCGEPDKAFLLNDGKVVQLTGGTCFLFSGERAYCDWLLKTGVYQMRKLISTVLPRKGIEYLPGGERVFFYEIPEIEGRSIRKASEPLSRQGFATNATEIYLTNESEVLEFWEGKAFPYKLFQSIVDYKKVDYKASLYGSLFTNRVGEFHPPEFVPEMCGRNPYGVKFPLMAKELAEKLPALINAPKKILRYNFASFPVIEKYFFRQLITADFADKVFLPLLAYLGLTFINQKGGEWKMLHKIEYDSWSPYILSEGYYVGLVQNLVHLLDWRTDEYLMFRMIYSKTLATN